VPLPPPQKKVKPQIKESAMLPPHEVDVCIHFPRLRVILFLLFPMTQKPLAGQGLYVEASRSHSDTAHSVGFLWTSDQPDNTQRSQQTGIHAPGRIRIRNSSKGTAAGPRLRQRGHYNGLSRFITTQTQNLCHRSSTYA